MPSLSKMTVALVRAITKLGSSFPARGFAAGLLTPPTPTRGVAWLFLVCLWHFTIPSRPKQLPSHEELIASLKAPGKPLAEDDRCPFCYENEFTDPIALPCKHTFCKGCVIQVLEASTLCPYCRRELYAPAQSWANWIIDRTEAMNIASVSISATYLVILLGQAICARDRLPADMATFSWMYNTCFNHFLAPGVSYFTIATGATIVDTLYDALEILLSLLIEPGLSKLSQYVSLQEEYEVDIRALAMSIFAHWVFVMSLIGFVGQFDDLGCAIQRENLQMFAGINICLGK